MRNLAILALAALLGWGGALLLTAADPAEAEDSPQTFSTWGWKTNFKKHTVPYAEILSGGPPKDGIPAVDNPKFVTQKEADGWLKDVEPVVVLEIGGVAKAYPLQILMWHEIVNDTLNGTPVSVTFCPLCNSAIAFDRRLDGRLLDFGTTGKLQKSNLVMYDRQTESWWEQFTGRGIVGDLIGKQLKMLPAAIVGYGHFKKTYPNAPVLSRKTGHIRPYGRNPYVGYDDINSVPFLFRGPVDKRLPPMERVVAVTLGDVDRAYPFSVLAKLRVVNDRVAGRDVVVFHSLGAASALDGREIAASRDVGATGVFDRNLDGKKLSFRADGADFRDAETGSRWTVLGLAVEGPLKGKRLRPILNGSHFAFSWFAFKPNTSVYTP
ncbi:MAG: DUF3179 domain-containing protein [Nitrospinota bacterium]